MTTLAPDVIRDLLLANPDNLAVTPTRQADLGLASLAFAELVGRLAIQRTTRALWAEALPWLVQTFDAAAIVLIFGEETARYGNLTLCAESVQTQIEHWELGLSKQLRVAHRPVGRRAPTLPAPSDVRINGQIAAIFLPLVYDNWLSGGLAFCFTEDKPANLIQRPFLLSTVQAITAQAMMIQELSDTNQRLEQMSMFYQVGQAVTSTLDLPTVLKETTALAASGLGAGGSALMLLDAETNELIFTVPHGEKEGILREQRMPATEGIAGWVVSNRQPLYVNDVAADSRFTANVDAKTGFVTKSLLCVPLQVKGRIIGVLEAVNKASTSGFDEDDQQWLSTLGGQAAIAIENARLYENLRREHDRIIAAQEEVRHQINRDLHDGAAQLLAALIMNLDMIRRSLHTHPNQILGELDVLEDIARQANREVRQLLFELRPLTLYSRGLVAALESYVDQLRQREIFDITLEAENFPNNLHKQVEGAMFAIIQEAVNNIKKHAQPRTVWLRLGVQQSDLVIQIEDDGQGFDVNSTESAYDQRGSFGLLNMRERASLLDGTLLITSPVPGKTGGALVTLHVPIARAARPAVETNGISSDRGRTTD